MISCLLATIGLSIYSIYRYIKNEDTISIKLTTFFSTKDAIYPSLSLCILPPFLERNFDMYGNKDIDMTSCNRWHFKTVLTISTFRMVISLMKVF